MTAPSDRKSKCLCLFTCVCACDWGSPIAGCMVCRFEKAMKKLEDRMGDKVLQAMGLRFVPLSAVVTRDLVAPSHFVVVCGACVV